MNPIQRVFDNLTPQNTQVSLVGFAFNLFLAAALSFVLSLVYEKYGRSLSNRKMFARNFLLITMTTMVVITVVKSSLALSLGLVGALSIVRFRAAIKEPEELAYLFFAIAIGLGLGADQRAITLIAFASIVGIIWVKSFSRRTDENQNLFITVSSHNPNKLQLEQIVEVLEAHCPELQLKRFDETRQELEASFQASFADFSQLAASRSALLKLNPDTKIIFLDNKGIV